MMSKKIMTFIFDFDSTIYPGESLDEIICCQLATDPKATDQYEQISTICNQGMSGQISMRTSLQRRLLIAAPTPETIANYVLSSKQKIDAILQNALRQLLVKGHQVLIISGGFEEWIIPIMQGIVPAEYIHANQIIDPTMPMHFTNLIIRQKESIIQELMMRNEILGSEIIMIGDGATDFNVYATGIANQFIGTFFYTGVPNRIDVINKAADAHQITFTSLVRFTEYLSELSK